MPFYTFSKKLWKFFPFNVTVFIIFALLTAIFETIGISIIYPMLDLLISVEPQSSSGIAALDIIQQTTINVFEELEIPLNSFTIAILIGIVFTIKTIVLLSTFFIQANLKGEFLYKLKSDLYSFLLKYDFTFFVSLEKGRLLNTLNEQTNRSMLTLVHCCNVVTNILTSMILIGFAVLIQKDLVIVLVATILFLIIVMRFLNKKVKHFAKVILDLNKELTLQVKSTLNNLKYIRVTEKSVFAEEIFAHTLKNTSRLESKIARTNGLIRSTRDLVLFLCVVPLFLNIDSSTTEIGASLTAIALTLKALQSAYQVQVSYIAFLEFHPAANSCFQLAEELAAHSEVEADKLDSAEIKEICLDDVCFRYPNTDEDIIHQLSVSFKRGNIYVVKGPSGCGKTTLLNVLMGLLTPTTGTTLINGVVSRMSDRGYRQKISYVPQEPSIVKGSLYDNLKWLRQDEIDDEKVKTLIAHLNLNQRFNDEASMYVGLQDESEEISGGQKQRISVLRELLFQKDLIVLDEPTSALDFENATIVLDTLRAVKEESIVVISSHDPNVIKDADYVVDLSK